MTEAELYRRIRMERFNVICYKMERFNVICNKKAIRGVYHYMEHKNKPSTLYSQFLYIGRIATTVNYVDNDVVLKRLVGKRKIYERI